MNSSKTLINFVSQINEDEFIEKIHNEVTQTIKKFIQHMKKRT